MIPGEPSPADDLRTRTVRGATWSSTTAMGRQALTFGVQIALARVLFPEDFGVAAMVLVISSFGTVIVEGGLGSSLIHHRDLRRDHLATVTAFCAALGLLLAVLIALAGPALVRFYDEPELRTLAVLVALSFGISSLGVVPEAVLARELRFKRLGAIELLAVAVAGAVALTLAHRGHGARSLGWQAVALSGTEVSLLWLAARPPLTPVRRVALSDLSGFGLNLLGVNTLNYWVRNADNVVVGRAFGGPALGVYSRAYAVMLVPVEQLAGAISRVMFPSLAHMGDDVGRVRLAYLRAVRVTALLLVPLAAGLAVCAEEVVLTVLGPRWVGMVPILQVLAALGAVQAVTTTVGWLYTSQGRTDRMLQYSLMASPLIVLSFLLGAWWGSPFRVALSYAAAGLLLTYPSIRMAGGLIGVEFRDVVAAAGPAFLASGAMVGAVLVTRVGVEDWASPAGRLAALAAVGACAYGAALVTVRARALADLADLAPQRLQPAISRLARGWGARVPGSRG